MRADAARLRRAGPGLTRPRTAGLGPKLASANPRNFSDEVLNQSKSILPQQAGFTGGANQSGMSWGRRREIDELSK